MSSNKSEEMKLKVQFGNDIRRWHCPDKDCYQALISFVETTFQLKESQFQIQYEDAEKDRITLSNEQDFDDAIGCALSQERASLKLFVVKTKEQNREDNSNNKKEIQTDNKTEESHEASQPQPDNNWRKMALDFLLDEKIKVLLPEFVRNVIKAMRESNSQLSLVELVQGVLLDEKFTPIVCHEFYQTKLKKEMTPWLNKISPFSNMLLSFNEEALVSMVSNAINGITTHLTSDRSGHVDDQMLNPMNFFFPAFHTRRGSGETIHYGVSCDGCSMTPIRGTRYKCTVCSNFDLCANCEASKMHDSTHRLIEMRSGDRNCMMGLGSGINGLNDWQSFGGCWGGQDSFGCTGKDQRASGRPFGCHGKNKKGGDHSNRLKAKCDKNENKDTIYGIVGAVSNKTWTVQNVGTEEWGEGVELVFIKGNSTLAFEKRYPVANLKPQESTQISAMIQIPSIPGHFSAGFRLEKNGQGFGPKLWADVQAIPEDKDENEPENENNNENKNENEKEIPKNSEKVQEIQSVVKCMCGASMIETSPMGAYYEGAEVRCDSCSEHCLTSSLIYHCSEKTEKHPDGYDLCSNCARSQMLSFEQPQEVKKEEPKLSEPKEPEFPKSEEPAPVTDPLDGFIYQEQARILVAMGVDLEDVKRLLVSKKGNLDEVVAELFQ